MVKLLVLAMVALLVMPLLLGVRGLRRLPRAGRVAPPPDRGDSDADG